MPIINKLPSGGGTYLKGAWTSTGTSTLNQRLTDVLTLSAGFWLVHLKTPVCSGTTTWGISTDSNLFYQGGSYFDGLAMVKVPAGSTVQAYIFSSASAVISYSNMERGFIEAIKLG